MPDTQRDDSLLKRHKTLFLIVAATLFIVEIQVLVIALQHSGRKATHRVLDAQGAVLYEADGKNLSSYDKYYFEKIYGPLDNYRKSVEIREIPFPFRAWFFAAIGIPVGALLLVAFVFRAYTELVHGGARAPAPPGGPGSEKGASSLESLLGRVSRLPVFMMGALVFAGVFAIWALPNMAVFLGKGSLDLLLRFKGFLLAAVTAGFGFLCWVVYLRYQLTKKNIDARTEVSKYRIELEYRAREAGLPPAVEYTRAELLPGPEENPKDNGGLI
jgi:hypothetical protein